jgi:hypothetical protein
MPDNPVMLTLVLTDELAQTLWQNSTGDFAMAQDGRFSLIDPTLRGPADPVFRDGSMFWCEHGSDALLLRAYEEACGHFVTLLGDEAVNTTWPYPYVVLSSRPWTHG